MDGTERPTKQNNIFIPLTVFPLIQIVRNRVVRNISILVLFNTIIRIIWKVAVNVMGFSLLISIIRINWKVAVNVICFSLLFSLLCNFPGYSECIHEILSTRTFAEWCALQILLLASTCLYRIFLAICTDTEVTQVEQNHLQQWPV